MEEYKRSPKTLGEAQGRLYEVERKLLCITKISSSYGAMFGILFLGTPKDTLIEDLFKTKAVGGDIDNGKVMIGNILRLERQLDKEIKLHPILAKRCGLTKERRLGEW